MNSIGERGSVIYDATAPASVEFAELYIPSEYYIEIKRFATTADREFDTSMQQSLIFTRPATHRRIRSPVQYGSTRLAPG